MADLTKEDLRKEITAILKDADLKTLSAKKVRQQIEEKLDVDLTSRKKEIDTLVMECVEKNKDSKNGTNDDDDEEEEEEEEEEEDEEEEEPPKKKAAGKRKTNDSDEGDSDEDYQTTKKSKPAKKGRAKKKKGSDSDSEDDWAKTKSKKGAKKSGGGGGGRKGGTGFTKQMKLSDDLAKVVGSSTMARHEVVKKMWSIIKERNLYDPKNKQFAICDAELLPIFGVKRFRTFGMLKFLKNHFIE